jgi:site-specific recombinase XerD
MTSLRRRMLENMQIRNLAVNTQEAYIQQVSLFARHFNQSPERLGPEQIRAYQVYLMKEKKLATGSILIAVSALRFLYKVTLKRNWTFEDIIPAPKKPQILPVVLSPEHPGISQAPPILPSSRLPQAMNTVHRLVPISLPTVRSPNLEPSLAIQNP